MSNPLIVNAVTEIVTINDLQNQLNPIISELNRLIPQLNTFVDRFQSFVNETGIHVVFENNRLFIEVTSNVSDQLADQYQVRVGVMHDLITNHVENINNLLSRGQDIENQIRHIDNNYITQLTIYANRLLALNYSFFNILNN
jgi:NADH:ubiquinone oxidoreductase subunit D